MPGYLIKRIAYALGVLIAVSLLTFFMSKIAPGDLVESNINLDGGQGSYTLRPFSVRTAEYQHAAERLGLDLPVFYCTIQPRCFPDTLFHIIHRQERRVARTLLLRYGDWRAVDTYRKDILYLIASLESIGSPEDLPWLGPAASDAEFLLTTADTSRMHYVVSSLVSGIPADFGVLHTQIMHLQADFRRLESTQIHMGQLLPTIHWYGLQNQYHHWIVHVMHGDFGRSLIDGRPVKSKIVEALHWTLSINIIAILLAFGLAIPLGVIVAKHAGKLTDQLISSVLFAMYAMPSFWLAMLCIVFLTTSEYGSWLDWFPTSGVGMVSPGMSFWQHIGIRISHLTLPVFCVLAGSLAYLTRQMRGSMLRELRQDYIRLAYAKGLSDRRVLWGHAVRNALFPMITMVGSAFPAAISGSVILEVLFSIPGMGRLLYLSILSKDWPVVYAMVLFAAVLTVTGYFVADVLYRQADPRVSFHKQRR